MFGACPKFSNKNARIIAAALVLFFLIADFGKIEFDIKKVHVILLYLVVQGCFDCTLLKV